MPKVGTFTISDLVDGQDMVNEQDIGMTLVSLTATERGAKIIITDKLARQNGTTDVFRMIGKQFGDTLDALVEAEGRRVDLQLAGFDLRHVKDLVNDVQ